MPAVTPAPTTAPAPVGTPDTWPSERVRDVRKALGLTQAELAAILNVHCMTVSRWERRGPAGAPSPYQGVLLGAFQRAHAHYPRIGNVAGAFLVTRGPVYALYSLLHAAYGGDAVETLAMEE